MKKVLEQKIGIDALLLVIALIMTIGGSLLCCFSGIDLHLYFDNVGITDGMVGGFVDAILALGIIITFSGLVLIFISSISIANHVALSKQLKDVPDDVNIYKELGKIIDLLEQNVDDGILESPEEETSNVSSLPVDFESKEDVVTKKTSRKEERENIKKQKIEIEDELFKWDLFSDL